MLRTEAERKTGGLTAEEIADRYAAALGELFKTIQPEMLLRNASVAILEAIIAAVPREMQQAISDLAFVFDEHSAGRSPGEIINRLSGMTSRNSASPPSDALQAWYGSAALRTDFKYDLDTYLSYLALKRIEQDDDLSIAKKDLPPFDLADLADEWLKNKNALLREGFKDFATFAAFRRAESGGQVTITGQKHKTTAAPAAAPECSPEVLREWEFDQMLRAQWDNNLDAYSAWRESRRLREETRRYRENSR